MATSRTLQDAIGAAASEQVDFSDELLMLGEREALDRHFDLINMRRLIGLVWALGAVMAVYSAVGFGAGSSLRGAVAGCAVVADLLLLRALRRGQLAAGVRQLCAAVLVGHLLALQLLHPFGGNGGLGMWFLLLPVLAIRFRVAAGEAVALFSSLYAVVVLRLVGEALLVKQRPPFLAVAIYAVAYLGLLAGAWGLTRRAGRRFLERWRAETGRHRDRLRMKQELEYAREIQLSMLPRSAPSIEWLDVAALSLPATEVGGDYYDYFILDADRVAVVVGDVTGHGVGSGLVLSGVRSCLNLLADELATPSRVFERVNLMLKRTNTRRMLMTLGVAVLDHKDRTVTVATAGHPPLLVWRTADGSVEEVGQSAVPLGALISATYRQERIQVAPGDAVVLYSDGLVETLGEQGEQYGFQRLAAAFGSGAADGRPARGVRDAILRDVWEHKGDAEQVDDVTMVVIRCQ